VCYSHYTPFVLFMFLACYCSHPSLTLCFDGLDVDSKRSRQCTSQERVGVQEEEGFLVMQKSDAFTEKALLEGAGEVLNSAMTNPMFGVL
jgi:hypothetical protein